jgi:hypothetical protein
VAEPKAVRLATTSYTGAMNRRFRTWATAMNNPHAKVIERSTATMSCSLPVAGAGRQSSGAALSSEAQDPFPDVGEVIGFRRGSRLVRTFVPSPGVRASSGRSCLVPVFVPRPDVRASSRCSCLVPMFVPADSSRLPAPVVVESESTRIRPPPGRSPPGSCTNRPWLGPDSTESRQVSCLLPRGLVNEQFGAGDAPRRAAGRGAQCQARDGPRPCHRIRRRTRRETGRGQATGSGAARGARRATGSGAARGASGAAMPPDP